MVPTVIWVLNNICVSFQPIFAGVARHTILFHWHHDYPILRTRNNSNKDRKGRNEDISFSFSVIPFYQLCGTLLSTKQQSNDCKWDAKEVYFLSTLLFELRLVGRRGNLWLKDIRRWLGVTVASIYSDCCV